MAFDPGIRMPFDVGHAFLAIAHPQILRADVVGADLHDREQFGGGGIFLCKLQVGDDPLIVGLETVILAAWQRRIHILAFAGQRRKRHLQPYDILAGNHHARNPVRVQV